VIAPQGGTIRLVAVADTGDAALTVDNFDQIRLWPTLDGKREPVVVRAGRARQLALGRDADGFLATVLDVAGGLELVRLDRSGALLGRAKVSPDPGFEQVEAIPGGVLARRRDHVLARYDATGELRGMIKPGPGEHVLTLRVRRTAAVAAIVHDTETEVKALRRIELGGELRWRETIVLPVELKETFAISPNGERIAGVTAVGDSAVLVKLAPIPTIIGRTSSPRGVALMSGFLDGDRVLLPGHDLMAWDKQASKVADEPSSHTQVDIGVSPSVGDGIIVSARHAGLLLVDGVELHYLGYRELGIEEVHRAADSFAVVNSTMHGGNVVWLDDHLRAKRIAEVTGGASPRVVVDDRHVIYSPTTSSKLALRDVEHFTDRELPWGSRFYMYEPTTHVLIDLQQPNSARRIAIDIAQGSATPLRDLLPPQREQVFPLDPTAADGVIAIGLGQLGNKQQVDYFTETPGLDPILPVSHVDLPRGRFVGVDSAGRFYSLVQNALLVVKHGLPDVSIPLVESFTGGGVAPRGDLVVVFDRQQLLAMDATGKQRWRRTLWNTSSVTFSADGRTIVVVTLGGLLSFEAATGVPIATACAWGFGLSTQPPPPRAYSVQPVCGE
jgi:hypothetical protein